MINIRDVKGSMKLAAGDSEVRVVGFNGEFASTTVDGDVYLEGVSHRSGRSRPTEM